MTPTVQHPKRPLLKQSGESTCTVEQLLSTLRCKRGLFALESSCNTAGYGRFSIVGTEPIDELPQAKPTENQDGADPFEALDKAVAQLPHMEHPALPFAGGWVGNIPYECGLASAGLPLPEGATPRFSLYDSAAIFDHLTQRWTICAVDLEKSQHPTDARIDEWQDRLKRAADFDVTHPTSTDHPLPVTSSVSSNMTREAYFEKVERAIEYIRAGDIFQVNLTQRLSARTEADALSLYLKLQRVNPADYSAFMSWSDHSILSASPELFVQLRPDGSLLTRPIKGTRPRLGDDESKRQELLNSEKDRAELAMIVDLLRNDLGRVSRFGSIKVLDAAELETHPTVHHLVATIAGVARSNFTRLDVIRAMFPGGSITGCPKIRAMQIIDELEDTPREAYCGAIGYFGVDGAMNMNIAIRTMIHRDNKVHIYAGGAITADSVPKLEFEETLAKARGMFRALGLDENGSPS